MALSANSVFEVRAAGSDTNGGGFVTGAAGTDFSQQNSKNSVGSNISATNIIAVGTSTLTSTTMNGSSAMVGNIIYLQGGTGTLAAGWYQITSFTSNTGGVTTFVVDRVVAAGTGITMNIGGALLTPGQANGIATVSGMVVFILNIGADGTSVYSITSTSTGVANGTIAGAALVTYQGYTSTRSLGNVDARPQLQINVASATLVSASTCIFQNLILNGNSQTSAQLASASSLFIGCLIEGFTAAGSAASFYRCSATANSAGIFAGVYYISCEAYANTATPFLTGAAINCLSYGNTGAATIGFSVQNATNCIAVSNGSDGFKATVGDTGSFINCHAESNSGYGFNFTTANRVLINCSYYGNTSGGVFANTVAMSDTGAIAVTVGSVFVNAAAFNFLLNKTASQGALLQAAADPSIFPRGDTNNYRDIGAAQHQDSPANIFIIDD